ncbi:hypothetical protein PgNI_10132 [Pyricularia grisea]|uniref:Uncharacterized protein n=1 Tax=Pyricularia grisea TaxID=148305 RepID=A0A6P8B062_PYRGI|nr:hypothetical protein PgNI_10132 [Pyricularia grisea]TLD07861.1 hypothetical protein PgNI_10132 [Pyricularia grisea]
MAIHPVLLSTSLANVGELDAAEAAGIHPLAYPTRLVGSVLYAHIVEWSAEIRDEQSRLEAAQLAFRQRPTDHWPQIEYIRTLTRNSLWQRLIDFVKWLNGRPSGTRQPCSLMLWLVIITPEIYDYIGIASR